MEQSPPPGKVASKFRWVKIAAEVSGLQLLLGAGLWIMIRGFPAWLTTPYSLDTPPWVSGFVGASLIFYSGLKFFAVFVKKV